MKKLFFAFIFILFTQAVCISQTSSYIRKAARATQNNKMEKARRLYLKALEKDKDNYKANVLLGITLSEFMGMPEDALPYLENAYKHSPKDTLYDLIYALAKCYQHYGRYNEALLFLDKLNKVKAVEEDDKGFQMDLAKRKKDCLYGLANSAINNTNNYYVVNLGPIVNTKMPEYVPVIMPNNELLFTSKRKDDEKEKMNDLDGKYFESMYICKSVNGVYTLPKRYTVPDQNLKSNFRKRHESVVSITPDGKKLFIYRDTKIFEINTDSLTKENPKKLSKSINFNYYQNHAYLCKDNKTLYFTSESDNGIGGLDIYKSFKNEDGIWSKPENLGKPINTEYDEDAPFLSDDGQTLYFASKGHPGYGNFDIYKSTLNNGKWSEPQNMGPTINSAAHDIFYTETTNGESAYFSSSRIGGNGDMDIYKINYFKNTDKECVAENNSLKIDYTKIADSPDKYSIKAGYPYYYKVLKSEWFINNQNTNVLNSSYLDYAFKKPGEYSIKHKVTAYCDTCLSIFASCNTITISISDPLPVVSHTSANTHTAAVQDIANYKGKLSNEQLTALGFNITPVYFNSNEFNLTNESQKILSENSEILKKYKQLIIEVYGYSDSRGNRNYNKNISHKRAKQTENYLIKNGVAKNQIKKTEGKGENGLLNECDKNTPCSAEKDAINRRVEIFVFKK